MKKTKLVSLLFITFLIFSSFTTKIKADHPHNSNSKEVPNKESEVLYSDYGGFIATMQEKNLYGKNIKIAILDTGFDRKSHEVHITKGYNFVDNTEDYQDDNGHGTKIASIIGAKNNGQLLLGIAPEASLYIGKIADENGRISFETLVKGIEWAIKEKVAIINLSIELYKNNPQMEDVVSRAVKKGILIVASSGNVRADKKILTPYPAKYPEVVSVGMLNVYDELYSEEEKEKKIDVYARGEEVTALYLDNKLTYNTAASFATANATGVFALLMEKNQKANKHLTQKQLINEYKKGISPPSIKEAFIFIGLWLLTKLPFVLIGGGAAYLLWKKRTV